MKALYGHEKPPSAQDVIEGRLIQIGLRVLEPGNNVVIDYGLWGRDERSALRQAAADLGALVEMHYFELTEWRVPRAIIACAGVPPPSDVVRRLLVTSAVPRSWCRSRHGNVARLEGRGIRRYRP